ncbi:AAA family ATPase [Plantactinospora solaniradicis]|uniref:AAA family ATPase n=1 Tax=Plantactinospora solaniradicis TaxID=1723736 RepID=A0ABW1K9X4_9ACTN
MIDLSAAVIVITGAMASGKSTVAQRLAERLPRAAHVRGDVFRRMIISGQQDFTPEQATEAMAQLRLRYRLSAATADGYAQSGFTAVVQDVILGPQLADYLDLITTRPRFAVVLAPRPEVIHRREQARTKNGYGEWTVESLDYSVRNDTPRLGLWLDNSDQTPDETVDEILANLAKAHLPH